MPLIGQGTFSLPAAIQTMKLETKNNGFSSEFFHNTTIQQVLLSSSFGILDLVIWVFRLRKKIVCQSKIIGGAVQVLAVCSNCHKNTCWKLFLKRSCTSFRSWFSSHYLNQWLVGVECWRQTILEVCHPYYEDSKPPMYNYKPPTSSRLKIYDHTTFLNMNI